LLARAVRQARLLRATWPLQIVLPLRSGLTRRIAARIGTVRIGPPQRALLRDDLTADDLRRVHLAHDALVARGLLRRDHERGSGHAAAGAGADRKAARALRERTEPRAGAAIIDVDMPNPAVGIGVKLDVVAAARGPVDLDKSGGAANSK